MGGSLRIGSGEVRRVAVIGGSRIPFARSDGLNVSGSSLATGHPFAATGARIVATRAQLLAERDVPGRALISVRAAGGQGVTAILERA